MDHRDLARHKDGLIGVRQKLRAWERDVLDELVSKRPGANTRRYSPHQLGQLSHR